MAAPTVAASLDKTSYAPGEQMVLTVDHADTDRQTLTVTTTVTDTAGNIATATATAAVDQGTVTVASSPVRTWTLVQSSTGRAVFTAAA